MSRYVQFMTPENIEISYELAGIGSRFIAAAVDLCIQLALIMLVSMAGTMLFGVPVSMIFHGEAPLWVFAVLALVNFFIFFGYHSCFEILWAGQTPGKKIAHLRVVRDGGWPIDPYSSIVRNLVRIIDMMPPPYGIAIISVFFNAEYKRLGDLAAGTIVIKERSIDLPTARKFASTSPLTKWFMQQIGSMDDLTPEEYQVIRLFNERRHELSIPVQTHIAMRLAIPILERFKLDIPIQIQWHYADLLDAMERRYVEERSLL